jgi:hypothetical protein
MDIKDICEHTRIKLIASAIGHQQCTKTEANIIPLPGTDRVIAIGTPAEVRGLLGAAPLTAPAPLTGLARKILMMPVPHIAGFGRSEQHLFEQGYSQARMDSAAIAASNVAAAPAPQQSESIITPKLLERLIDEHTDPDFGLIVEPFARAIERELAKAAPAAPVQRIPDILTVETIQGAIAFGRMGINPPPSPDHWGNEFWQIGRQLAKLGETSAWDNVTPVDVAAPVQADQAQVERAAAVRADYSIRPVKVERDENGWWSHPGIPNFDEDAKSFGAWIKAVGLETTYKTLESEGEDHPAYVSYFALEDPSFAAWTPTPPEGEGWFTFSIHDTEDGPVWAWARPLAAQSTATSNDTGALGEKGAEA